MVIQQFAMIYWFAYEKPSYLSCDEALTTPDSIGSFDPPEQLIHDPFGPEEIFLAHLPTGMRIQVWTNVHGHPWCLS